MEMENGENGTAMGMGIWGKSAPGWRRFSTMSPPEEPRHRGIGELYSRGNEEQDGDDGCAARR